MSVGGVIITDVKAQGGHRPYIADMMTKVDARNTPLWNKYAKKAPKMKAPLAQWSMDKELPPENLATTGSKVPTAWKKTEEGIGMGKVYFQWDTAPGKVDHLSTVVGNLAGIDDHLADAKAKCLMLLKRSAECVIGSDQETQEGSASVPYLTRGTGKYLQATAQAVLPVPDAYRTPSTSIITTATESLTEADINGMLKSVFDNTGATAQIDLYCGSTLRTRFKDFRQTQATTTNVMTSARMFTQEAGPKITNTVSIYEGDFGTVRIFTAPFLAWTWGNEIADATSMKRGYALADGAFEIEMVSDIEYEDLPGDGTKDKRFTYSWKYRLICTKPKTCGKLAP